MEFLQKGEIMNIETRSKIGLAVTHTISVYDASGNLKKEYNLQKNKIVDSGLNMLHDSYYAQVFEFMAVGTGGNLENPVLDDEVALVSQLGDRTNTYITGGFTYADPNADGDLEFIYSRLFSYTVPSGTFEINEIGLSRFTTGDLFSRLILETPISVTTGDIIQNSVVLAVVSDKSISVGQTLITGLGVGSFKSSISPMEAIDVNQSSVSRIGSNGATIAAGIWGSAWSMEPCSLYPVNTHYTYICISNDDSSIDQVTTGSDIVRHASSTIPYGDDFKRSITGLFTGAEIIGGSFRNIFVGVGNTSLKYDIRFRLDDIMAVDPSDTLTVTFTKAWGRLGE